jgi:hypothetical protein
LASLPQSLKVKISSVSFSIKALNVSLNAADTIYIIPDGSGRFGSVNAPSMKNVSSF